MNRWWDYAPGEFWDAVLITLGSFVAGAALGIMLFVAWVVPR